MSGKFHLLAAKRPMFQHRLSNIHFSLAKRSIIFMTDNNDLNQRFDHIEKRLDALMVSSSLSTLHSSPYKTDEIDLRELFAIVWQGKWWIIGVTFIFALASVFYAQSLPNIYKSEALLASAEDSSGGSLSSGLGGLASLAGVNIVSDGNNKTELAMSVLKSRDFISGFVQKHELMVPLFAVKGWDQENDQLLYDSDVYDIATKTWVGDGNAKPSSLDAYEKFREIMQISKDNETKLFTLSVDYYSPKLAKYWVDQLVEDLNLNIKSKDVAEANQSINYLNAQLKKTSIAEMQAIIYGVIEEQFKKVMFAEVREEYVFKTIDRAVVPEKKAKPAKALICILGTMLGCLLGATIVFFRYFIYEKYSW